MKNKNFIESFNRAMEGFFKILCSQRNMRIHLFIGLGVILLGLQLNFNRLELAILIGMVGLVLFAEMVNTLVELLLDFFKKEPDDLVKLIKDISAGTVLIISFLAFLVGYILFFNRMHFPVQSIITRIKESDWHITLIIFFLTITLVILVKQLLKQGRPLRGGLPSGHSAFAFSVWTLTILFQKNNLVSLLVLILSILIARSRIKSGVHNLFEVVSGALLGILVTILVYQFFR